MAYTDYQQRALYGAGQSAARAGQRFHMERGALERGDKDEARYHRARANALNRQGAYAAVRGMGGDQGENQYFPVQSSGQPIYSTNFPGQFALSSQGKEVFDQFRDSGFVEPIRQKKRYAPNTEGKGLGWLMEKALGNTMMAKVASQILPKKKPRPDDAYYKSLWGKGLNEMYSPSGIFSAGKFLGNENIDPYYERPYKGPKWAEPFLKPFVQPRGDAFGVVRDSSIPEDWEFMQETPMDYTPYVEQEVDEVSDLDLFAPYVENSQLGISESPYYGRGELSEDFDYSQFPSGVDEDIAENIEEVIEEPNDEEIFNQTYEFIQDRGDDPNLPTAWEYMIQMQDLLGWEDERMTQHLIDNGVLRKK
jgi:hypothetical protein